MKKRRFMASLISSFAVLSLTACAGNKANDRTEESQSQNSSSDSTEAATEENSVPDSAISEQETQSGEAEAAGSAGNGIVIAYFTAGENSDVDAVSSASVTTVNGEAKGRLRAVADMIQEGTGGELFSIQTAVDYPGNGEELIDYAAEEQDQDARPELISHIENLDDYETIFVGFPTWWYDMPQALYSFFDEYDFSGKTIIPFNVHNGSRFSGTIDTIKELEPEAEVIEDGFTVSESNVAEAQNDVMDWLNGLGY